MRPDKDSLRALRLRPPSRRAGWACRDGGSCGWAASGQSTLSAVRRSREEADAALGVLAHRGERHAVADFPQVRAESFFLRLRSDLDAFDEVRLVGLEAMREHDEHNGTEYTRTVYTYLRCLGDSARAAAEMYVHPNTLRYRIKRAGELFGIDLRDPDEALLLWLRLRLQH